MVLQIEESTNILKALHTDIDFIFIFDHPCGNDRRIEDRLNVTNMNSGCGVSQRDIQPTIIKQEVGYLVLH